MTAFAWRIHAETYHHDRPFNGITPMALREATGMAAVLSYLAPPE